MMSKLFWQGMLWSLTWGSLAALLLLECFALGLLAVAGG
jgi:hypothetical protein